MSRNALAALQRLQKATKTKDEAKPSPAPLVAVPGFETVAEMPLGEFARAGLVVRVTSRLLGEDVLLVSDNALGVDEDTADLVVYRASEAVCLVGLRPEDVRELHRRKKLFKGASVVSVKLNGEEGNG